MKALITDTILKDKVQKLLDKGNYVISLSAPDISSPFPLWIYKGTIKMWIDNRWKNVGECTDITSDRIRINENGVLKRTE